MTRQTPLPESQMGPAERLLDLVLSSSAHLWHNRPGVDVNGVWQPARVRRGRMAAHGIPVKPGLHLPAAETLYARLVDIYKRLAWFVDRIARGTEPAELPVELPTRVEFVVNRKAAAALGVAVPKSVLLRADRVIE